jgi:hypothetical protein
MIKGKLKKVQKLPKFNALEIIDLFVQAGFEVVVDNVEAAHVVAAVDRAVNPVEEHIVGEREVAIHPDARITPGVVGP